MSDFGFEPFDGGLGDVGSNDGAGESSGPYIPSAIDCMRCGICVGGCPTYKVRAEENYSPRGRVRLIEKVLKKDESLSDDELGALDACTQCRACESVCPSQMQYDQLYRQATEVMAFKPAQGPVTGFLLEQVTRWRSPHRAMNRLIPLFNQSGMRQLTQRLAPTHSGLHRLIDLIPRPYRAEPVPSRSPATGAPRGRVALFTGCIGNLLDTQTHNATIKLLTRLGYDVQVHANQTCCGAMYAHNGELQRAEACARQNITALTESGCQSMVYSASGCGAFFSEYDALLGEGVAQTTPPIVDILDFLVDAKGFAELEFRPLPLKVAVHEPCSQRNVLKNQQRLYDLLALIPGLQVIPLTDDQTCCGAGGTKMLRHPEIAEPLRNDKVACLAESGADLLVSSNLTCALHLASGIRAAGHRVEVMHPIRLLAQQLL